MAEQVTGHADGGRSDEVRVDKERGHSASVGARTSALFEEGLHLVEEAVAVLFHRHAALFGKFCEQFFLASGQFGGNLNLDGEQLVAGILALEAGNAQALEAENLILLRAGRNLDDRITFECGDLDLSSERRCDKVNRHFTEDVVSLALEDRVWLNGNRHIQVAGWACVDSVLPPV